MSVLDTSALVQCLEQKALSEGGTPMRDKTFVPREYDVFAGLDVDKKSIAATFSSHQGFIRSLSMPYKVEDLLNHVRNHFADQKVAFAYEAGPTVYGLYDGLAAQGYRCLIAAPSMIPRAPGQRVKTNRLDSKALSESLRGGQLKSIHVPSPLYRQLRHLTQLRDTMMSEAVGMKQRIKSLLLFEGITFPPAPAGSQWSFIVKAKLRKLPCSNTVRFKLDQLLDSLEFAEKQVFKSTKEIRRFCQTDPELSQCIKYMMTVSGSVGSWPASFWRGSAIGASLKTSANWEAFWVWFPWSTPPEIKPIGDRSPIPAMGGFEVSSFRPRGRRFEKMVSLENFSARFANAIPARWRPGSPLLQWRANSACGFLWS